MLIKRICRRHGMASFSVSVPAKLPANGSGFLPPVFQRDIDCKLPVGVGGASPLWIATGEQSGLLTRIAATESVSLCTPIKS
jgi:hypothetical protein